MIEILSTLGYKFSHPYPVWGIKHAYPADFYIHDLNLIIEVDGRYYHNYPIGTEKDAIRTQELKEAGYKVLRFWEGEFDIEKVKLAIDSCIGELCHV